MNLKLVALIYLWIPGCARDATSSSIRGESTNAAIATQTATIFDARTSCSPAPMTGYDLCDGPTVLYTPQALSTTSDPLLIAFGAKNTLVYVFQCSSTSPLLAEVSGSGGFAFQTNLNSTKEALSQTLVTNLQPGRDGYTIRVYDPSASRTARVDPECSFKIVNNFSEPLLDPTTQYVAKLQSDLASASKIYEQITSSSTTADTQNALRSAAMLLQDQLPSLIATWSTAASPAARHSACKRINDVWTSAGEFDSFGNVTAIATLSAEDQDSVKSNCLATNGVVQEGAMISLYKNLATYATSDTAACSNEVDLSKQAIKSAATSDEADLQNVIDFLNAEVLRLQDVSAQTSQMMQTLLSQAETAVKAAN